MAYRKNVTDKQQADIERFNDHSAIRFSWFDGKALQTGETKSIPAYDLQAQGNGVGAKSDAVKVIAGTNIIGSHNDHPSVFENPGKA
jgi:hypothetical protein